MRVEGAPDPLERLLFKTLSLVLVVYSCEEPSVKTHFSEESGVSSRVSKGIHVPSNPGLDPKLVNEELVSLHHVVHDVLVVGACLIIH